MENIWNTLFQKVKNYTLGKAQQKNLNPRYFEQGEIFPKIENSDWERTIWYLEITNKQQ